MEENIFVIVNGLRVKIKMSWTVSAVASSIIGGGSLYSYIRVLRYYFC
jgi:hypothetical protein